MYDSSEYLIQIVLLINVLCVFLLQFVLPINDSFLSSFNTFMCLVL
jgi:hypothetical protein